MDNWLLQSIKRTALRCILGWIISLFFVLWFISTQKRYIENFLKGPFPITQEELASIKDIQTTPHYFVKIQASKIIETGFQEVSVEKSGSKETSRSVSATYFAFLVGKKLLLVKSRSEHPSLTMVGELTSIPLSVEEKIFATPEDRKARALFYSFYLEDTSFRSPGYFLIGFLLLYAGLFAFKFSNALRWFLKPSTHALVRRAETWGPFFDQTAEDVKHEASSPKFKTSGWKITEKYLIQNAWFAFNVYRQSDVIWLYKKVIQQRVNGIPAGKRHQAIFKMTDGNAEIFGNEKKIDAILFFVGEHAPWAICGFSDALEKDFKKNRAQIISEIEKKKREWNSNPGPDSIGHV